VGSKQGQRRQRVIFFAADAASAKFANGRQLIASAVPAMAILAVALNQVSGRSFAPIDAAAPREIGLV
jgi:hypothetical protein